MSDYFLAIILYFQTLAGFGPGYVGTMPAELAPPGPAGYTQEAPVPAWIDGTGAAL